MEKQLDYFGTGEKLYQAEQAKEVGILQSAAHADDIIDGWTSRALLWVQIFLTIHGNKPFMGEDVRNYASERGFDKPPHLRAWGYVIRTAAKQGIIRPAGYQQTSNPLAHKAVANLWVKG